jgi:hypothetical protein
MFRIAHYRKRAIIGHTTMFFVQCSGNLVITNYAPILYGKLGYDANKQLLMAGAWITMCPFGNLLNAFLLDKVGRRLLLSGGLMGCTLCLVAEAVSVARFQQTGSQAASLAAVAFLFIHVSSSASLWFARVKLTCEQMFFFCTTQDASSYVYVSEIFPTHSQLLYSPESPPTMSADTVCSPPQRCRHFRVWALPLHPHFCFCCSSRIPKHWVEVLLRPHVPCLCRVTHRVLLLASKHPCFVHRTRVCTLTKPQETRGLPLEEIAAKFGDDTAAPLEDVMKHDARPTEPRGDDSLAASNVDLEKARHELVEQV